MASTADSGEGESRSNWFWCRDSPPLVNAPGRLRDSRVGGFPAAIPHPSVVGLAGRHRPARNWRTIEGPQNANRAMSRLRLSVSRALDTGPVLTAAAAAKVLTGPPLAAEDTPNPSGRTCTYHDIRFVGRWQAPGDVWETPRGVTGEMQGNVEAHTYRTKSRQGVFASRGAPGLLLRSGGPDR